LRAWLLGLRQKSGQDNESIEDLGRYWFWASNHPIGRNLRAIFFHLTSRKVNVVKTQAVTQAAT